VHEIKHDGFRLMARRDAAGARLPTRNGHDWAPRYPLIVEAVNRLKVRSCLIDGEAVCCDDDGLPTFQRLRLRRDDRHVFLSAFDLLELDGKDLRREPLEVRKATLASLLRGRHSGLQYNQHLEHPGDVVASLLGGGGSDRAGTDHSQQRTPPPRQDKECARTRISRTALGLRR
jgi:bifunctional non-homologous end joining protein LigD